jgi:hypothetical protein
MKREKSRKRRSRGSRGIENRKDLTLRVQRKSAEITEKEKPKRGGLPTAGRPYIFWWASLVVEVEAVAGLDLGVFLFYG